MPVTNPKKVPKQIQRLLDHLRATGTGSSKLDKIKELALVAKDGKEFLESVKLNVPQGTWAKVEAYLADQEDLKSPEEDLRTSASSRGRVEARSEDQSSIPERTIVREDHAPTLGKQVAPGVAKSRQLGGDVIVDPNSDPLGDPRESDEGDEEEDGDENAKGDAEPVKTDVTDLNASEAKDKISRMQSRDKLQLIADNDERVTVQDAAKKRLEELGS